jgi:CoA:oxalate CoA-transferase
MLDCQIAILENAIARYCATGETPRPLGARHPSIAPFEAFAARDAHIIIAAGNDALFARLCATLGRPDLAANPLFETNEQRSRHADALKSEIEDALASRPAAEWLEILDSANIPCAPINTVPEALANPQIQARNMVVTIDEPEADDKPGAGDLKIAGNPVKLSAFADPTTRAAAPELDGDRARILAELETPRR